MSQGLPSGAQRVQDFLSSKGSGAHVQLLANKTATAHDAANALGVPVRQIGKSIVFGSGGEVTLVVLCGDQKVDTDTLARVMGIPRLIRLRAEDVKVRTKYVIGGVSPFALPPDVNIIIDSRLYSCTECFVAAGHPKAVVRTSGRELVALVGAAVATVAEDS